MADTPRATITEVVPSQTNKVTQINEALNVIDTELYKVQYLGVFSGAPSAVDNDGALAIFTDLHVGDETWLCYSNGSNWIQIVQVNGTTAAA